MIKQIINIKHYWRVIVYYNVDYNFFDYIARDLIYYGISRKTIYRIYNNMRNGYAKAVTITPNDYDVSIVLFNKHKNKYDYINSIAHEAEHIKQSMLYHYDVPDRDEAPAYTIGFLLMKMLDKKILNMLNIKYS